MRLLTTNTLLTFPLLLLLLLSPVILAASFARSVARCTTEYGAYELQAVPTRTETSTVTGKSVEVVTTTTATPAAHEAVVGYAVREQLMRGAAGASRAADGGPRHEVMARSAGEAVNPMLRWLRLSAAFFGSTEQYRALREHSASVVGSTAGAATSYPASVVCTRTVTFIPFAAATDVAVADAQAGAEMGTAPSAVPRVEVKQERVRPSGMDAELR